MRQWLAHQVRDLRIAFDRVGYERAQQAAHRAEAAQRFDSTAIKRQAEETMVPWLAEDRVRFGRAIQDLEQAARDLRTQQSADERNLCLLERDFAQELASAYAKFAELQKERQSNLEEHQEALADFREVKSDIDWWYRKSDCYVFDRGRPIPQRRLVGADKNDLKAMKAKKLELQSDLDEVSAKIDEIDTEKAAIKREIASLHVEKAEAQRLKQGGICPSSLRRAIQAVSLALDSNRTEVASLRAQSHIFLENAKVRSGASALLDEAKELATNKDSFLAAFNTPEARLARALIHRQQWLDAKVG